MDEVNQLNYSKNNSTISQAAFCKITRIVYQNIINIMSQQEIKKEIYIYLLV